MRRIVDIYGTYQMRRVPALWYNQDACGIKDNQSCVWCTKWLDHLKKIINRAVHVCFFSTMHFHFCQYCVVFSAPKIFKALHQ